MTVATLSSRDALKVRVANIKPKLPLGFRDIFFEKHPKFDNAKGASKLKNVLSLVSADEFITEALEAIAEEIHEPGTPSVKV